MDLTQVPDDELNREAWRREHEKRQALQREATARYLRERKAQEAKDREFATRTGITWEQYQQAEDYIRDKVYAEQE